MPWNAIIDLAKPYGPALVILVIAIFGILNLFRQYITRTEKARYLRNEEIKLLMEVLDYKGENKKFLIEQLIETKYKALISWREISYLMSLHSPSEALSLYASSGESINFDYLKIEPSYSDKLGTESKRTWTKRISATFYFFYSFLGLLLLICTPFVFEEKGIMWGIITTTLIPLFIGFAVVSLKQYAELKFAKKLFELILYSKEHPQTQTKNHLLL
ncbi:hypothetical protein [Methylophaga thalassica]|uniref:hypothetical protein n=1 Tax=Methylophaga aminisulfidivorans TaxID=230105 RepID=UPI003A8CAF05